MLMMAALTILSLGVLAQDSAPQKVKAHKHKTEKTTYHCPMHHDVLIDQPGKCSTCGMDLVKSQSAKEKMKMKEMRTYTCPMHPDEMSNKPGTCPVCGSKLNLSPKEKMKMFVLGM